jgi:hypothetical protein
LATDNITLAQKVDNLESRLAALEQKAGASHDAVPSSLSVWSLMIVLVLTVGLMQVGSAIFRRYRTVKSA